jgi:hypothetical protein
MTLGSHQKTIGTSRVHLTPEEVESPIEAAKKARHGHQGYVICVNCGYNAQYSSVAIAGIGITPIPVVAITGIGITPIPPVAITGIGVTRIPVIRIRCEPIPVIIGRTPPRSGEKSTIVAAKDPSGEKRALTAKVPSGDEPALTAKVLARKWDTYIHANPATAIPALRNSV